MLVEKEQKMRDLTEQATPFWNARRVPCPTPAPAMTSALIPGKNTLSHRRCFYPPCFIGVPFRINFIVHSGRLDVLFTVRTVWARTVSVIGFLVLCNYFHAFWPKIRWNKSMVYYFIHIHTFVQYVSCWFKQHKSVYISGRSIRRICGGFSPLCPRKHLEGCFCWWKGKVRRKWMHPQRGVSFPSCPVNWSPSILQADKLPFYYSITTWNNYLLQDANFIPMYSPLA